MKATDLPAKVQLPFASGTGAAYIRTVPVASQIGITDGAASFTDGFPPMCYLPIGSGGKPPAGVDIQYLFYLATAWNRWQAAAGLTPYDAAFSTQIAGYPKGATILSATTSGRVWISTADSNTTNPDSASAANWLPLMLMSDVLPYTPAGARRTQYFQGGVVLSDMPSSGTDYVALATPTFTGVTYASVTARCSIANPNSGAVNLYAKTRVLRVSDSNIMGVGQFVGGVCFGGTALPFSVRDDYTGLDPTATYIAQLVTSKIGSVSPVSVNDCFVLAQTN